MYYQVVQCKRKFQQEGKVDAARLIPDSVLYQFIQHDVAPFISVNPKSIPTDRDKFGDFSKVCWLIFCCI